ncbi:MFS transporter [Nocardioides sp. Kera G14]|uniref:MFS transporter n=1 Tax=Nocardioides sp. Kera G14 TaxID=2884264 RepID=UPI001D114E23|nr:MFS transporter [Nocardioides sp. Kera G14]UDY23158.1 MFS transporter [Nocardioides sp. Kera G14]
MAGFRELARNHDFSVLWIGQTVSELGARMSSFVFPIIGFALTGSAFWAASVEAVHLLGIVGMLLPGGLWADRLDRARLMRTSTLLGFAAYASVTVAGVSGHLTTPHLLVAALAAGVATGLFEPAESSAIRSLVSDEELPTAYSQMQAREHIASLLGGPIGGVLYGVARWLPFLADALSYAFMWVLLHRLRTPLPGLATGTSGPLQDVAEGLRFSWSTPFFRVLMVWAPLMNLVANAVALLAILRLVQAGTAPATIALVEVAAGVAGILGAVIAPWLIERIPTGMLSVVLAWFSVPLLVPLAFWNSPIVVGAMLVLVLLVNPAGNAGIGAYRTAITPRELLGRTRSAMQFVSMSAMPLAPLVAGGLLTHFGGRDSVLVMALLLVGVALIPTLSTSVRSVPRPAVWRVERMAA